MAKLIKTVGKATSITIEQSAKTLVKTLVVVDSWIGELYNNETTGANSACDKVVQDLFQDTPNTNTNTNTQG